MIDTHGNPPFFINEHFFKSNVDPDDYDQLLADGWRHFGTKFFRYNLNLYRNEIRQVIPLRIRLANFVLSKSQKRVLRRNKDLHTVIRPIEITDESQDLFNRHKQRFEHGVPESIYDFLSREPAKVPCDAYEIAVRSNGKLVAVSYFDVGRKSTSGIYAIFDPDEKKRSLGIFTMLKEIEFARNTSREFYYQGYSYEGSSFYDYKKQFAGTESFYWEGTWRPIKENECRPL